MIDSISYVYDGTAKQPSVIVMDGGNILTKDIDYTVSYTDNINLGTAKVTVSGKGTYTGTVTKSFNITIENGISYTVGSYQYTITSASTVSVTGAADSKITKVKIPKAITIGGSTFNVTAIGNNAFRKNTMIKNVTIGDNIKTIGKSAFEGCTKLTKITAGKGVTEISGSTFKNCTKLKKSTTLKKIGKSALKGIKATAKVKVPAKKLSAYKKLFKNKGQGKKVKITK